MGELQRGEWAVPGRQLDGGGLQTKVESGAGLSSTEGNDVAIAAHPLHHDIIDKPAFQRIDQAINGVEIELNLNRAADVLIQRQTRR